MFPHISFLSFLMRFPPEQPLPNGRVNEAVSCGLISLVYLLFLTLLLETHKHIQHVAWSSLRMKTPQMRNTLNGVMRWKQQHGTNHFIRWRRNGVYDSSSIFLWSHTTGYSHLLDLRWQAHHEIMLWSNLEAWESISSCMYINKLVSRQHVDRDQTNTYHISLHISIIQILLYIKNKLFIFLNNIFLDILSFHFNISIHFWNFPILVLQVYRVYLFIFYKLFFFIFYFIHFI